jgi:hypothetical protein
VVTGADVDGCAAMQPSVPSALESTPDLLECDHPGDSLVPVSTTVSSFLEQPRPTGRLLYARTWCTLLSLMGAFTVLFGRPSDQALFKELKDLPFVRRVRKAAIQVTISAHWSLTPPGRSAPVEFVQHLECRYVPSSACCLCLSPFSACRIIWLDLLT